MTDLFGRKVLVRVNGLEFSSVSARATKGDVRAATPRINGFRIRFKVERSVESKSNKAQCSIENLARGTQGKLDAISKPEFEIEAGYRDLSGIVFKGKAVLIAHEPKETGTTTTIQAADGLVEISRHVSASLPAKTDATTLIATIAKQIGVSAEKALAQFKKGEFAQGADIFIKGITLSGTGKSELDKLARTYGFDWSIQNEELTLTFPKQVIESIETGAVVRLSENTGMINGPVRIYDKDKPKDFLIKVKSLLRAEFVPHGGVLIESANYNDVFQVRKVVHTGDSQEGEFSSELECRKV